MTSDAPSPTPEPGPAPAGAQDRDTRVLTLAAYVRTNREAFTDEALRRAAAAAGYDEREIAAAWAVSAEPVPGRKGNARAVLTAIGYFVGVFVIASILSSFPETAILGLPAIGAGLLLAVLLWLTLKDSNPPLADAFKIGVIILLVLPLALALVALGVCMVGLAAFQT